MSKEMGEILIYEGLDGKPDISVRVEGETVWLTQAQLTELFQSSKTNVSEHIKHIFEEGELDRNSVVRKFRTTARDGKNYSIEYYDLDMIISLGYRIRDIRSADWVRELDKFAQMYGKGILDDGGTIGHDQAMEKAEKEYRKYQVKTLSPVEKAYLDSIVSAQKKIEQKTRDKQ